MPDPVDLAIESNGPGAPPPAPSAALLCLLEAERQRVRPLGANPETKLPSPADVIAGD